jgi:hypothetical protein
VEEKGRRAIDRMQDVPPKVDIEKREYTVPLVEPWKLPTTMQWELSWDNQVVVGPVATWIRETIIQNSIPTEYLRGQTAGDCSGLDGRTEEKV